MSLPSDAQPTEFAIDRDRVAPGERRDLRLEVGEDYIGERLWIPLVVVHGARRGPVLALTAAIHGDELNGVAVVRDVLALLDPEALAGTVLGVPIVNVLGVQFHSRYLPDRRDLNRHFPGSSDGSLASRIANALMTQVIERADVGIDLHTATNFRTNEPQVRVSLSDSRARDLGIAFGCAHLIDASTRPGSLRDAAARIDVPVLTFEGGQALRFEHDVVDAGRRGVLRVMAAMGMLTGAPAPVSEVVTESDETHWVRADRGGILELTVGLGDEIHPGQPLWTVSEPLGEERNQRTSPYGGIVIGMTSLPLVTPGDAVVHIAVPGRHERTWIDEPTDEEDEPTDEGR
jgi:uncharacterized protein